MRTYAIADLHGRFDLLMAAYDAISEHSDGRPSKIVHLGDYIDRGPQSREVIEWLMDDAALPPWVRRIVLRGNHEDIMVQTLTKPLRPDWWIGNGGGATLISYGHAREGLYDPSVVPAEHIAWMAALPRLYVDRHRVFVHAGVSPSLPLDQQDDEAMGWMIYPDGAEDGHGDRHVVHGHVQFADGPKTFKGRTDLDTFAWYTGRLVIGVFEDSEPGGAAEFLEVKGEPYLRESRVTALCPHCRKPVADANALYQHVKVKHRGPIKQGKHKRPFRQPREESDSVAFELIDAIQSGERPAHLVAMFPEEFHG